jgi:hypothetical protein
MPPAIAKAKMPPRKAGATNANPAIRVVVFYYVPQEAAGIDFSNLFGPYG